MCACSSQSLCKSYMFRVKLWKRNLAVNDACNLTVNAGVRQQAANLMPLFVPRMLQVIIANEEHFGRARVHEAQQQQAWLADLQARLLSGNCFQRFLSQRCAVNSQVNQVCGHQAFAQAVSGMIRCFLLPRWYQQTCTALDQSNLHLGRCQTHG